VVPRWNGDTNFMTVLGEVRSIPEHIEASRDKLRPFFQGIV
jgi:ATP adenylyltransferase